MVETDVMPAQSKVSRMLVVRGERSFNPKMQTLKFASDGSVCNGTRVWITAGKTLLAWYEAQRHATLVWIRRQDAHSTKNWMLKIEVMFKIAK